MVKTATLLHSNAGALTLPLLLFICLVLVMALATGAVISSTAQHIRTVERLAQEALNSTALALASTTERMVAERGAMSGEEFRDVLSDRVVAYALIASENGTILFHTNPRLVGAALTERENMASFLPLNMTGRRVTLQTGTPAYEFFYILHRDDGAADLLKIVLHTFPADSITERAKEMWWSVAVVLTALWIVGLALAWTVRRYAGLQAKREKDRQMAVIGQMTSVLAHEIRNAIGGVKGFTQWIDEKTESSDHRKAALALVLKGTGRIETLVNDLLLYARNETYSIESVNVAPLLDEAMTVATASWEGEKKSEFDPDIPVLADREKLLRVLLNGMQNAVQAMGDGGHLRVSAKSSGRWVTIVIEDNGPGISPDVQEHLFSPFYTTKPTGTGLGLAYCGKAIGDMKGTITLMNRTNGRGAALTIRLPAPP